MTAPDLPSLSVARQAPAIATQARPPVLTEAPPRRRGLAIAITLLAAAALCAAETPLLWKFFVDLWHRPQYQFFPLLLIAIVFMAISALRDFPADDLRPGRPTVGVALGLLACLALIGGGALYLKWLGPVSALLLIAAIAWNIGGRSLLHGLLPMFVMSVLLIPPPGHFDEALLMSLRRRAVQCSAAFLEALGVPTFVQGSIIQIPGARLLIEEACSGINSMLAVLSFTVLLCFWKRLAAWSLVLLLPIAFAYVFWANVLRITLCGFARARWNVDLLSGTTHELIGLALFLGCMGLVFSTITLGQALLHWDAVAAPVPRDNRSARPSVAAWPGKMLLLALMFVASGTWVYFRVADAWPVSRLPGAGAFQLPQTIGNWSRIDESAAIDTHAEVSGLESHQWQYRDNGSSSGSSSGSNNGLDSGRVVTVALDYPFYGYHDATTCYALAGWQIGERAAASADRKIIAVTMHQPPFANGRMIFGLCDENGVWAEPFDLEYVASHPLEYARHRARATPLAQVQVFGSSLSPLTHAERESMEDLFRQAAESLRSQIVQRPWEHQ